MAKKGARGPGSGARMLAERVRTARGRSHSSTLWLERQLNDPWVKAAKDAGYRSRAAFKLIQLDEKFDLLKRGQRVVDLGAAPGGWSQVAAAKSGQGGSVLAVDILEMEPLAGVDCMQLDFTEAGADTAVMDRLGGQADIVICDMAAPATGHRKTDHLRIVAMAELAHDFARQVLVQGGALVIKLLQGGGENSFLEQVKRDFADVRFAKPEASRKDSAESYLVARGFRGGDGGRPDAE
ncbi:MAG: RlmE family RNA methyltransferase [Pseudomonadota bacterium]|nr:RlmE family RNA methyltransferase [Pseudomonadota bacterium]